MKGYRFIDLFAGIGGIRLGFESVFQSSECVFVSEWDKWAAGTYRENFGPAPAVSGDITAIDAKEIPPFDICLAGFPCQAFSIAGSHGGFDDDYYGQTRGTLFREVVRICDHHRPQVIFCENVKGLVGHDRGRTFSIIKGAFAEIGYTVFSKVLNSKDFGVPQNRERIYLVCFRDDIDSSSFTFNERERESRSLREILDPAPIPSKYYLSERYLDVLKEHKQRHAAKGNGFGYVVRDLDGIAGAIVCGGMGRERNLIVDNRPHSMVPTTNIKGGINAEGIRKLTPREWARLQGFPDTFKLTEADTHLYKQLGNSVTVPVIASIAKSVKAVLDA